MTLRPDDLEPGLPDDERPQLARTAELLSAQRPVPAAAFRGTLGRRLAETPRRRHPTARLRLGVSSLGLGAALLLLAAVGLADVGPLAPDDVQRAVAAVLGAV